MSYFSIWKLSFWCLSAYGLLHIPIYRSSRWLQCLLWTSHRLVYTVVEWHYCLPWTVEQCQQLAPKVFYIHLGMYTHTVLMIPCRFFTLFLWCIHKATELIRWALSTPHHKYHIGDLSSIPASIFSFSFSKLHTELQLKTLLELGPYRLSMSIYAWNRRNSPAHLSKDIMNITS